MHITDLKCICGHRRTVLRVCLKVCLNSVHLVWSVATSFAKSMSSLLAIVSPLQLGLHKEVEYSLYVKIKLLFHFLMMYRDRLKGWYVVARNFFLLLLNCSAWPCLAVA